MPDFSHPDIHEYAYHSECLFSDRASDPLCRSCIATVAVSSRSLRRVEVGVGGRTYGLPVMLVCLDVSRCALETVNIWVLGRTHLSRYLSHSRKSQRAFDFGGSAIRQDLFASGTLGPSTNFSISHSLWRDFDLDFSELRGRYRRQLTAAMAP